MRESDYYIWLRDLAGGDKLINHSLLVKQLDTIPFEWIFALDGNRAAGGEALRSTYADENSIDIDDVRSGPCTVLEMLISLANHMTDQLAGGIDIWFWKLIENLHLNKYDDDDYDPRAVEFIVMSWLHRSYKSNGEGSLFPLKEYRGDCRNLDIWSQMNAWINENYPTDDSWLN